MLEERIAKIESNYNRNILQKNNIRIKLYSYYSFLLTLFNIIFVIYNNSQVGFIPVMSSIPDFYFRGRIYSKEEFCRNEETHNLYYTLPSINDEITYVSFKPHTIAKELYLICDADSVFNFMFIVLSVSGLVATISFSHYIDKYGRLRVFNIINIIVFFSFLQLFYLYHPVQLLFYALAMGLNFISDSISSCMVIENYEKEDAAIPFAIGGLPYSIFGILCYVIMDHAADYRYLLFPLLFASFLCIIIGHTVILESLEWSIANDSDKLIASVKYIVSVERLLNPRFRIRHQDRIRLNNNDDGVYLLSNKNEYLLSVRDYHDKNKLFSILDKNELDNDSISKLSNRIINKLDLDCPTQEEFDELFTIEHITDSNESRNYYDLKDIKYKGYENCKKNNLSCSNYNEGFEKYDNLKRQGKEKFITGDQMLKEHDYDIIYVENEIEKEKVGNDSEDGKDNSKNRGNNYNSCILFQENSSSEDINDRNNIVSKEDFIIKSNRSSSKYFNDNIDQSESEKQEVINIKAMSKHSLKAYLDFENTKELKKLNNESNFSLMGRLSVQNKLRNKSEFALNKNDSLSIHKNTSNYNSVHFNHDKYHKNNHLTIFNLINKENLEQQDNKFYLDRRLSSPYPNNILKKSLSESIHTVLFDKQCISNKSNQDNKDNKINHKENDNDSNIHNSIKDNKLQDTSKISDLYHQNVRWLTFKLIFLTFTPSFLNLSIFLSFNTLNLPITSTAIIAYSGDFFAFLFSIKLKTSFGRKNSLLFSYIVILMMICLHFYAQDYFPTFFNLGIIMILIFSNSLCTSIRSHYINEVYPTNIRGQVNKFFIIIMMIGMISANYSLYLRLPNITISLVLNVITTYLTYMLPDSRYVTPSHTLD